MGPQVIPAYAGCTIRFAPAQEPVPLVEIFNFDPSHWETETHRYEVRFGEVPPDDDDGEPGEASTLVEIDKRSGVERVVFEPPPNLNIGISSLGRELVVTCGTELYFITEGSQFRSIEEWYEGNPDDEPLAGCLPVDYEFVAHPRVPLLIISAASQYRPVSGWIVVRRGETNHLIGGIGSANYAAHGKKLVLQYDEKLLEIENVDALVESAVHAPLFAYPWDELLTEITERARQGG
jgi:hypothetical protein